MKSKKQPLKKLLIKNLPKKVVKKNRKAIESYGFYKKVARQIDIVNYAMGKKPIYRLTNASTLRSNINLNDIGSTQNIQINTGLA